MSDSSLAYVFWHWKHSTVDSVAYEARQRGFHDALAEKSPNGFSHSMSLAVSGLPWANGGAAAYEDWYFIRDSGALDALDESVTTGLRRQAHDRAAEVAGGGAGGLYRARLGRPVRVPGAAMWLARPDGMGYDEFFRLLDPIVNDAGGVLWMRRMVLGPSTEFCLQSPEPVSVPSALAPISIALRSAWSESS